MQNVDLPTQHFLTLKHIAEQAIKAYISIQLLQEENQQLKQEKKILKSNYDFIEHRLNQLKKETTLYTAVPTLWREHIDSSILYWQKIFSAYCHDVNRATLRVFIASHGNYRHTEKIMHDFIKKTGIDDVHKYIANIIHAANLQHKNNFQPTTSPPSWKKPKPSETDYSKPDELGVVPLQLSHVPDINWDMINWDLLSELDKDEIREKIALARWL